MEYKIFIYGAGKEYAHFSSYVNSYTGIFDIQGIITTEKQIFKYLDGRQCFTIDEIEEKEFDFIIIAVQAWREVAAILWSKGIPENKIIRSTVFYNPNFDFAKYLWVKESQPTIFSNMCLAGVIYKELGLRSLSPTINMTCVGDGYIEFLKNWEYYCSKEIRPYTKQEYDDSFVPFHNFIPRGIIGDKVTWFFNHFQSEEEGITKWGDGLKRINKNNIVAIAGLESDEDAYAFEQLPIEKKIGFYYKDLNLEHVLYLKEWDNAHVRYENAGNFLTFVVRYCSNSYQYSSFIDWINFLYNQKNYVRFFEQKEKEKEHC
nr:DUF1919 domain-containing protein [uncultured Schaedlerella sp.]